VVKKPNSRKEILAMSIAVAVRKGNQIVLAADTQKNFGSFRVSEGFQPVDKIRKIGLSWVAATGWALYDNLIDDMLKKGKRPVLKDRQAIFAFFMKMWRELREKYSFVNDQCDDRQDSPFADLDSDFLIVNPGGIFHVASNMSVTEFDRYYAIGSGSDFAVGALHILYDSDLGPEEIARRAVETAIEFNIYCGGSIQVQSVKTRKN
jgi:ATP-dependent HslUV protease, peptidase subunit HslV